MDLESRTQRVLDHSDYMTIHGASFSPDGRWVAFEREEAFEQFLRQSLVHPPNAAKRNTLADAEFVQRSAPVVVEGEQSRIWLTPPGDDELRSTRHRKRSVTLESTTI